MSQDQSVPSDRNSRGVASTSRSLLVRVKDDESEAWDRLVSLYAPLVYHWCRRLNLADSDVPDVAQEVFKAVSQNIDRFRKSRPSDTFRGWLRTITRSKAMDNFRRQGRDVAQAAGGSEARERLAGVPESALESLDEEPGDNSDDDGSGQLLLHQALELIRNDFHERTWQAFWRIVVDNCSPAEVAKELDMKPGAVRVAKCRVLQRLRQDLGELL